jgi:hypothetical protein
VFPECGSGQAPACLQPCKHAERSGPKPARTDFRPRGSRSPRRPFGGNDALGPAGQGISKALGTNGDVSPSTPHWRDRCTLLETFIAKVPRPELVEHLRSSQSLRNRYFPGFRISDTVPTRQQVLTAYKKEIVGRNNGKLASSLCAHWIRQQALLATVALKVLNIQSEDPADANSWINEVHARFGPLEQHEDGLRALVRELAAQFPSEDVHIFVSIISYGTNQQTLRNLVANELLKAANDPHHALRQRSLTRSLCPLRVLRSLSLLTSCHS